MLTALQVAAFLSFLLAFNVEPKVVQQIELILTNPPPAQSVPPPSTGGTTAPLPTNPPVQTVPTMPEQVTKELRLEVSAKEIDIEGEQSAVITVSYFENGVSMRGVNVMMKTPDESQDAQGEIIASRKNDKFWYRGFTYKPKSQGDHSLTFCVGDTCRSVTIKGI